MLKTFEQNGGFSYAIILSIVLHCSIIAILILLSVHQPQKVNIDGNKEYINAMIVDSSVIMQQYNPQRQQQVSVQQPQKQKEELQQKQAATSQRLKELEKQRIDRHENAKTQLQQQARQQKQTRQVNMHVANAAGQTKTKTIAQEKQEKNKAYHIPQQKTNIKQSSEVDNLLGVLVATKNTPKSNDITRLEINSYLAQVRQAISNKFYDASNYSGKTCILHINLAPDGMLISIRSDGGDPALCQTALLAAKLAIIPRPPNPKIYEAVKNTTLNFKP